MTIVRQIIADGTYGDLTITGHNRNLDIGLHVHVSAGDTVKLGNVTIRNVFIPLIKTGEGKLVFDRLHGSDFGGDMCNIRASNVQGNALIVRHNTPTRPYETCIREGNESVLDCLLRYRARVYDYRLLDFEKFEGQEVIKGYHCDGVMQLYAVKGDGHTLNPIGVLENIRIKKIDAILLGEQTQGIMGSERNRYTNIHLGEDGYRVALDGYPYHAVFNQLDSSSIGGEGNYVTAGSKIRIKAVKPTKFKTFGNMFRGFGSSDILESSHDNRK